VIENELFVVLIENGRKKRKTKKEKKGIDETEGERRRLTAHPTFVPGRDFTRYKCEAFVPGTSPGTNSQPHLCRMVCTSWIARGLPTGTNECFSRSDYSCIYSSVAMCRAPSSPFLLLHVLLILTPDEEYLDHFAQVNYLTT
jgi:hypothetical protein